MHIYKTNICLIFLIVAKGELKRMCESSQPLKRVDCRGSPLASPLFLKKKIKEKKEKKKRVTPIISDMHASTFQK